MARKRDVVWEKLAEARREQILEAAKKVFAEKGFRAAKMKEVADVAGVSNGTVYNYFRSKDEVLMALLRGLNEEEKRGQQMASLSGSIDQEHGVREGFLKLLEQRLAFLWPNLEVFQAVLPELLSNRTLRGGYWKEVAEPTFALAEEAVEKLVEGGVLREMDVRLTVRWLASSVLGMLLLRLLGEEFSQEELERLPQVAVELFFEGLEKLSR